MASAYFQPRRRSRGQKACRWTISSELDGPAGQISGCKIFCGKSYSLKIVAGATVAAAAVMQCLDHDCGGRGQTGQICAPPSVLVNRTSPLSWRSLPILDGVARLLL